MQIALRIALSMLGLLYLFMGAGFLADPVGSGSDFGLQATGAQGLASIRGDFTSFFWVLAASLTLGAWRNNATLLGVGAALAGIVFAGRCLSLVLDGAYDQWFLPMVVEALTVALALFGIRALGRA